MQSSAWPLSFDMQRLNASWSCAPKARAPNDRKNRKALTVAPIRHASNVAVSIVRIVMGLVVLVRVISSRENLKEPLHYPSPRVSPSRWRCVRAPPEPAQRCRDPGDLGHLHKPRLTPYRGCSWSFRGCAFSHPLGAPPVRGQLVRPQGVSWTWCPACLRLERIGSQWVQLSRFYRPLYCSTGSSYQRDGSLTDQKT